MTVPPLRHPFSTTAQSRVHGKKLHAALRNSRSATTKYSALDQSLLQKALVRYDQWVEDMTAAPGTGLQKMAQRVDLLNEYKRYIELDLIWDGDTLYRSKGQHKIDNALMEEFLPWLVDPAIIVGLNGQPIEAKSAATFAAMGISSTLHEAGQGVPGLSFRRKDQDFAVGRELHLKASFDPNFPNTTTENHTVYIGYVAAECKTNLDSTMYGEATTTARDLKIAIPASKYVLICEYLDMPPQNHRATDISEVLILRGPRLGSQHRSSFSNRAHRVAVRDDYEETLIDTPIRKEPLEILVRVITDALGIKTPSKAEAIAQGHF
jgi:hypothetical protein